MRSRGGSSHRQGEHETHDRERQQKCPEKEWSKKAHPTYEPYQEVITMRLSRAVLVLGLVTACGGPTPAPVAAPLGAPPAALGVQAGPPSATPTTRGTPAVAPGASGAPVAVP